MTSYRLAAARSVGRWIAWGVALLVLLAQPAVTRAESKIRFNRDIRPILSDNCFACHGPDSAKRKAGLRLDTKQGLFGETKKEGPVLTPGELKSSALWKRITTTDADDIMPPPESHKELKPEQKETLRQWIAEGAEWQPHWSFLKPERPAVPAVAANASAPIHNPIDAFISSRLAEKGLTMNAEADRHTLARRLSLDLTGLSPRPEDVDQFVADPSPDYYEKYVGKLMDSPQWGEHRARYWLDAARYADTHGLHFDNYREMWPYRDWVIRAFNRNEAFDQFTLEQIAGDLLPDPSQEQLIATGFHRCNVTTNEGGTIEEENLANYANDRVTTTGWVFLGLTVNCATCHDHKFDPVSTRDFYSMAAFFRNTTQSGFDGNVKDGANASMSVITDQKDQARWEALPGEIDGAKKAIEQRKKDAEPDFAQWVAGLKIEDIERDLSGNGLAFRAALDDGNTNQFIASIAGQEQTVASSGAVSLLPGGRLGTAPKFGPGATASFPTAGDFDHGQPFSYGAWVFVPAEYNGTSSVFARMDEKNDYRGWDLWIQGGQFAAHIVNKWPENAIKVRAGKRPVKKGAWQHVFVTYDGSGKAEGLKMFVDGVAADPEVENRAGITGSIRTTTPLKLAQRSEGAHFDNVALQDLRIYSRILTPAEVGALANSALLRESLGQPLAQWKPETRQPIFDYFLATRFAPYGEAQKFLAVLEREREMVRSKYPVTHIQREKAGSEPMAHVLFRGQYDKPKDKVGADVVTALHKLPEGASRNRLGLAQWLISPENPLTARVTVNRFWQEVFGVGLVKSTEDFGVMGENPVNPALLDWLALEFRDSGWNVKQLFTLMVTSSAYRQSARVTPEKLEKDPQNRLLSRGPRFRMDAEMIRDCALAASGLLVPKIGGPSVKPYQPEGVWEAVAMPESNTRNYKRDSGDALYRRSLYTFWKRAAPPAFMDIFNAPSRESCTVRRERTDTPLQALATLNDPQFIEAARHLAETALEQSGGDNQKALAMISRRLLFRSLRPEELEVARESLKQLQAFYDQQPDDARKLVAIGETPCGGSVPVTQLAALTMVANQFMNLDEVLNK